MAKGQYRSGRIMAICLDTEFETRPNAIAGVTKSVTLDQLKKMSDEGMTHAEAARKLDVPDSTFRTFLNRNKLRYLFTKNKRNHLNNQDREAKEMTRDGKEVSE